MKLAHTRTYTLTVTQVRTTSSLNEQQTRHICRAVVKPRMSSRHFRWVFCSSNPGMATAVLPFALLLRPLSPHSELLLQPGSRELATTACRTVVLFATRCVCLRVHFVGFGKYQLHLGRMVHSHILYVALEHGKKCCRLPTHPTSTPTSMLSRRTGHLKPKWVCVCFCWLRQQGARPNLKLGGKGVGAGCYSGFGKMLSLICSRSPVAPSQKHPDAKLQS